MGVGVVVYTPTLPHLRLLVALRQHVRERYQRGGECWRRRMDGEGRCVRDPEIGYVSIEMCVNVCVCVCVRVMREKREEQRE